ncbi:B3 domain-containing protein [Forsythia ovata]|uniref:B3 domain-containing protein n=1 Tax=Forsythia ovata TaxID=205694 RepID=A0ABD1QLV6_9LAMI
MMDSVNTNFRVCNSSVMKRAKEVQSNLDPQFPSFLKLMQHSHVTKGFLLVSFLNIKKLRRLLPNGLVHVMFFGDSVFPHVSAKRNMPKDDETVVLENESGKEYRTKYLGRSKGLSGGWRGFSVRHNLLEGDVAIFHLVRFCKFKVYIVRASSSCETDGALGNLNLPPNTEERDPGKSVFLSVAIYHI